MAPTMITVFLLDIDNGYSERRFHCGVYEWTYDTGEDASEIMPCVDLVGWSIFTLVWQYL